MRVTFYFILPLLSARPLKVNLDNPKRRRVVLAGEVDEHGDRMPTAGFDGRSIKSMKIPTSQNYQLGGRINEPDQ